MFIPLSMTFVPFPMVKLYSMPYLSEQQRYLVTLEIPLAGRLRQPMREGGVLRGHPHPGRGTGVPMAPLLSSSLYSSYSRVLILADFVYDK